MSWNDYEEIGMALHEAHPDVDPLAVRFTDLHRMVTELEDFDDDPKASNEAKLEAIQMAWYEEWRESQG
ncbi:MAG: Fe-S cluster assembly protein IscX [Bryobacteraceae bacterium]